MTAAVAKLAAIPPGCEEIAQIAAPTCAAIGDVSVSYWLKDVREGRAPQPVVRAPRCTRWLLADVKEYWRKRSEQTAETSAAAIQAQARAAKASSKARAVRAAGKASHLTSV